MSIPLQASIPLALHLNNPSPGNEIRQILFKPGEIPGGRTVDQFDFLQTHANQAESARLFAEILKSFYHEPDWSKLHEFFSKRYSKREMFSDRDARRLMPPAEMLHLRDKKVTVNFKTDPTTVGVAADIKAQLAKAGRTIRSGMIGPDPQSAAIGPAIGLAIGGGAFMDLMYTGESPGQFQNNGSIRSRSLVEWVKLWRDIAEWVYEHEAASLEHSFLMSFAYKPGITDQERRQIRPGEKVTRQFLATDAIDAADTIRDVFIQLELRPMNFHGMEWDFLELQIEPPLRHKFYNRFGTKHNDRTLTRNSPWVDISSQGLDQTSFQSVSASVLNRCPTSVSGAEWEAWFLSVQGGQVIPVTTVFQALWAIMFTSQLPLNIEILPQSSKVPLLRDPDTIYL